MPAAREYDRARLLQLGEQLRVRRFALGYPTRPEFIAALAAASRSGTPPVSEALIRVVETGRRPRFAAATFSRLELVYQLERGTMDRFMTGQVGGLEPLPDPVTAILAKELNPGQMRAAAHTLLAAAAAAEEHLLRAAG